MPSKADRAKAATIGEMASRAHYEVLQAGREVVQRSSIRWRRVTDGKPCGFCAMLASRGPVYHSQESAEGYHARCGCTAEPFDGDPSEWEPTPDEARFIDAYRESYQTGIKPRDLAERIEAYLNAPPSGDLVDYYGGRLHIQGSGEVAAQHLSDLSEHFSPAVHATLKEHFDGSPDGGFYIGDAAVPELDDLGHLRGVLPRGHDVDSTWDTVPGAYDPTRRVCACGGGGHGHGSTSLALHEGSHALDDALGLASGSDEFRDVYFEVHGTLRMNPYFTHPANPSGYLSEGFAESFAAWSRSRSLDRDGQIEAVSQALGGYAASGPQTRAALGRLVDYLSGLESRMSSR